MKLIILIFTAFLATKSWAILGGVEVNNPSLQQKIVMFDTRVNNISIVCSGSFINKNKLITAAHCFDHLKFLNCLSPKKCAQQKLIINNKSHAFKVSIHPNYLSKSSIAGYQTSSNFDIAVLELQGLEVSSYFKIHDKKVTTAGPLFFYGYGMTMLKKKSIGQQPYYEEQGRGQLLKGVVQVSKFKNGLILNTRSNITLDKQNKAVASERGQVLRSDSGGPLVMNDEIVGIVRNYQISDYVLEASQAYDAEVINKALNIQSTFTTLSDSSTQRFLKAHR